MTFFILIKRKGARKWRGVIPAKRGVSKVALVSSLRKRFGAAFLTRIVTKPMLLRVIKAQGGIR